MTIKYLLTVSLLLLFTFRTTAQTNPQLEAQARAAIQAKGLDETEVRKRLLEKGVDIDNVTPEQLPQLQPTIEAVIAEMEAEKTPTVPVDSVSSTVTPDSSLDKTKVKVAATKKNNLVLPPTEIFGHHLFRAKDLAVFSSSDDVKPPDSYVLGSGDELTVSIFGASQFDSKFTINKDGFITPSRMPKIFLRGITLGQARELVRSRFAGFYRFAPEQFAMSLTGSRSITVNIFGEATNPGSYTLPAVNTAFNALVAAGGPTELGTVRSIKIIRAKSTRTLDLYEMINNPGLQFDFSLENNDIVHVPVADRVVSVQGAVRRPFRYELVNNENLVEVLQFAGGLSANAFREVVQVKRFSDDRQVLIDVNLKKLLADKQNFVLLNGDSVFVKTIPNTIENVAVINGKVDQPGSYAVAETPRISDLLRKGGLRPDSRTDLAFLLRENPDSTRKLIQFSPDAVLRNPGGVQDLLLAGKDQVTIYARSRYTDFATFSVVGAIRDSIVDNDYPADSSLTLSRAVLLAGGLRTDANGLAYIIRTNPENLSEKTYLPVDLDIVLNNPGGSKDVVLEPFDIVQALSAQTYNDETYVRVVGAIRTPGTLSYSPTLTLKDALLLSGGMRLEAATNRIDIYRVSMTGNQPTRTLAITAEIDDKLNIKGGASDMVLQPFDEVVVRSVPDFEFQQFVEVNGEVQYPGRYALINDNETLSSIIQRAGGVTAEADDQASSLYRKDGNKGLVVTRLDEALRSPGSVEDHILKSGDMINVPKKQNLVTIKGANTDLSFILKGSLTRNSQINVAYHPGKKASWYVREYAGGFTRDANKKRVYVEQPNGKINRTKNYILFKSYPKVSKGSVVVVPAKIPKDNKSGGEKKKVDWDKKLTQILAVTSVITSAAIAIAAFQKN